MRVPFRPRLRIRVHKFGRFADKKNETLRIRGSPSVKLVPEKNMSIDLIAMLTMAATIVVMVLWVPLLDVICPPCRRFLERRRNPERSRKATSPTISSGTGAE
jgi:hypothetical protein